MKLPKIEGVSFVEQNTYNPYRYRVGYKLNGKQKWRYFNTIEKADNFMGSLRKIKYF